MTDLSGMSDDELLAIYAMPSLIKRESGGRAGVTGPKTQYGQAQGLTQMLPATAKATADRLGVPWQPEMMTGTSPEAADYQERLGRAYLQQGIKETGNLEDGLRYYHGGPDRKLWGPKTEDYARGVSADLGIHADLQPAPVNLAAMSDEELLALYGDGDAQGNGLNLHRNAAGDVEFNATRQPAGPTPRTVALLAGRAKPGQPPKPSLMDGARNVAGEVVRDAASGAYSPVKALLHGVGAAYDRSKERLKQSPFEDPVKTTLGDYATTAGIIGDVAALPGAFTQAAVRPISRQLAKLPATMYATPGFLEYSKAPPRELKTREERAAAFEADINTALSGARPANVKGPPVAKFKDLEALKKAKSDAYAAVDAMGVRYEPSAMTQLSAKATKAVADEGGVALYPKSAAMVQRIDDVLTSPDVTLGKLDKLRAQIGERVIKEEPTLGYALRDMIDDFIDAADPKTILGGNGAEAAEAIRKARELNMRFKKAESVTNALESAELRANSTYAGGNLDNAIRQNIRPLVDPKSSQRIRNFTPAESRSARRVVKGGPAQGAVRLAGKMLDPRGLLGAVLQAGMGVGSGGLSTASIPLGMAATEIGKRMTQGNARALLNLIAAGGKPPAPSGPGAIRNVKLLSPAGAVGAGVLDSAAARIPGPEEQRRQAVLLARAKASSRRR